MQVSFGIIPLVVFPSLFYLSFKWPNPKDAVPDISQIGLVKRFLAFFIDMHVSMFGVLPAICMPILILEYMSTGQWVWSFERDYSRATDGVSFLIMMIGFFGFFFYWIWHSQNKKQTFGQRLFKFG